jgi:translation initiation factor 2 subunit 2
LQTQDAEPRSRRPSRKSVAFTEEKVVVDADGSVTMVATPDDDAASTALSHTSRTPPLSAALEAFADASQAPVDSTDGNVDNDVLDLSSMKKKKKSKKVAEEGAEAAGEDAAGEDGGLDMVCLLRNPYT